jgi:hypothetical protein
MRGHSKETATFESGSGPHQTLKSVCTLIQDFLASRSVRDECLSTSGWDFVITAPLDQDREL